MQAGLSRDFRSSKMSLPRDTTPTCSQPWASSRQLDADCQRGQSLLDLPTMLLEPGRQHQVLA